MESRLHAVVAHSDEIETTALTHELIHSAQKQLGGRTPKAALLFAGIDLNHAYILRHVTHTWPGIHLIGCTTDGELSSTAGTLQDSVTLLLLDSDHLEFTSGTIDQVNDVESTGADAIAEAASASQDSPTLGILLADGLLFNVETLLSAFRKALGERFPLYGGMAADQWQFKGTQQFYGSRVLTRQACYLLIHGELDHASAIGTGWKAIGKSGTVTQSQGSRVEQIDNRPALEFYQNSLGPEVTPSNELPVAVYDPQDNFQFLRTCFEKVDPNSGAITFLGEIPNGYRVRMAVVDRDAIVEGAYSATRQALRNFTSHRSPAVAFGFSCSARRALLGTRTPEETEAACRILGDDVPVIGFYTYGELAPTIMGQPTQVHNETFSVLLLG